MKRKIISALAIGVLMVSMTGAVIAEAEEGVYAGHSFILEGHRGISQQYPENTVISFEEAAKVPAFQGIETDVQETADGVLVLFHDRKLDKVTDAKGAIKDYTFAEVEQIKIDNASNAELYPDEKIPTLEDYLEICYKSGKIPYIELKQLSEAGIAKLMRTLDEGGWENKCVLTTFRKEYIPIVRAVNASYPIQYMIDKEEEYDIDEMVKFLSGYENMAFRPSAYAIDKKDVKECRSKGIRVECYGLNVGDKEQLDYLKQIGVKGVTCNDYAGLE